tara:strand:+ start:2106 stop:2549 length:444 start_codon:yes stop_codon:yes gene_type:complete
MSVNVSIISIGRSVVSLCLISLLLISCSWTSQPPRNIVNEALQTQIVTTQTSISESLGLDPMINIPKVSRVRVIHHDEVQVQGERFVHLEGSFDWQLPQDSIRVDSAFELYLQRGQRGDGWTLARPVGGQGDDVQHWLLYPLGLPVS